MRSRRKTKKCPCGKPSTGIPVVETVVETGEEFEYFFCEPHAATALLSGCEGLVARLTPPWLRQA